MVQMETTVKKLLKRKARKGRLKTGILLSKKRRLLLRKRMLLLQPMLG